MDKHKTLTRLWVLMWLPAAIILAVGCRSAAGQTAPQPAAAEGQELHLPALQAAHLNGRPLRVVATTSIIGDVVAQVGGEHIDLTVLMGAGQDPHSYAPSAGDLTAVAEADVIFVNGWDLEESLVEDLHAISAAGIPIVPISAGIEPFALAGDHDHAAQERAGEAEADEHIDGVDPHVWLAVANVEQWVANGAHVLRTLDPANAEAYARNAAAYRARLADLEEYVMAQVAKIPDEQRRLVTNHDALGHFAHAYGFEIIGTVIPAASTLAEPSADDLAGLIRVMEAEGVCTIFAETTAGTQIAHTITGELSHCASVQVLTLYTGALGERGSGADSGADSYVGLMRTNVDTIVQGLGQ